MDREEALRYATEWAGNWNARDLEAVLAHFDHDAVLSSPKAVPAVGVPTERGRAALLEYWTTALQGIRSLRFSVRRIIWGSADARAFDRLRSRDRWAGGSLVPGTAARRLLVIAGRDSL